MRINKRVIKQSDFSQKTRKPISHNPEHIVKLNDKDYFYRTETGRYYGFVGLWQGYAEDFVSLVDNSSLEKLYLVGDTSGVCNFKKLAQPYLDIVRLLVAEEHVYRNKYSVSSPSQSSRKRGSTVEANIKNLLTEDSNVLFDEDDSFDYVFNETTYRVYRVVAVRDMFIHNVKSGDKGGYATLDTKFYGNGWIDEDSIALENSVIQEAGILIRSIVSGSDIRGRVSMSTLNKTTVGNHGIVLSSNIFDSTINGTISNSNLSHITTLVDSKVIDSTIKRRYTLFIDEVLDGVNINKV